MAIPGFTLLSFKAPPNFAYSMTGFSGSTRYTTPGGISGSASGFFIEQLFSSHQVRTSTARVTCAKRSGAGGWRSRINSSGEIAMYVCDGAGTELFTSFYRMATASGSVHLVTVYDGTHLSFYAQGRLVGIPMPMSGYTPSTIAMTMGSQSGASGIFFSGSFFYIGGGNGTITMQQIQERYKIIEQTGRPPTSSSIVYEHYWPIPETMVVPSVIQDVGTGTKSHLTQANGPGILQINRQTYVATDKGNAI